ncbi:MAG: hypothetical protein L3K52_17810 [Candidatus Thiothrix sulfatifontis]|nr:MAG: hypothetical protein L3K52_17810 [Candidatus Thiothrix sulfatifontis]
MKHTLFTLLLTTILVMATNQANAATFEKTGKITRVLSDSSLWGGCMIELDSPIANGCGYNDGWVSLDCKATSTPTGEGNRHYASALLAASLNKQVTVHIDTNIRVTYGYCVATRIDTIF